VGSVLAKPSSLLAQSQSTDTYHKDIISTRIDKSTSAITVITRQEIEKKQVVTLDELLRDIAGVQIARFGTIGEQSRPRLRGADRRHLLVMLDGVVINPAYDDVFDFADFHVDNIDRVEIVRGNHSALFGSEAISGVFNIITRKPEKETTIEVLGSGGSFSTFREAVSARGIKDDLGFALSASRTDSQGTFDRDQYANSTFSANLTYGLSENSGLNLTSRYIESTKEIAVAVTPSLMPPVPPKLHVIYDQNAETKRTTVISALTYDKVVSPTWNFKVKTSYFRLHLVADDEKDLSPPVAFLDSDTESVRYTVETQHNFNFNELANITTGIIYEREEVVYNSNTNFPIVSSKSFDKYRVNQGYYLQNIFDLVKNWRFIAGGRLDHYSSFGNIFSPRFSTTYLLALTKTRLKSSYSQGFHAPSFDQLYGIGIGNKDLEAEKSTNYEIGLEQTIIEDTISIGVTGFYLAFRDRIVRGKNLQYDNSEEAWSRGVETYLKVTPFKKLNVKANYTFTETKNKDTGKELIGTPKHKINFNLDYDLNENINLSLDINYVGRVYYGSPSIEFIGLDGESLSSSTAAYTKIDLAFTCLVPKDWHSLKKLDWYGYVMNLFDEDYSEIIGAPAPGINFLSGLKVQF